jgi:uncharacterized LabA/DUF88 family protein
MEKIAFFIDWENFKQDIYAVQKSTRHRVLNFHHPEELLKLFKGFIEENEKLLRIFFYTSYPVKLDEMYINVTERKNLSRNMVAKFHKWFVEHRDDLLRFYDENSRFLDELSCQEYIDMRAGELKINGVNEDASPIFVQKQVDMLMGLDIAHVSYRKQVDKVVIFSKDTDIVPAMRTARNNGIETVIANLENGHKVPDVLGKHSDHVRTRTLSVLFKDSEKKKLNIRSNGKNNRNIKNNNNVKNNNSNSNDDKQNSNNKKSKNSKPSGNVKKTSKNNKKKSVNTKAKSEGAADPGKKSSYKNKKKRFRKTRSKSSGKKNAEN